MQPGFHPGYSGVIPAQSGIHFQDDVDRRKVPRPITLWLEPIITIAGLARLYRDFGRPVEQLGMQSKTWKEIETLRRYMEQHGDTPEDALASMKGSERTAFKKVIGLRRSQPSVLWLLGPDSKADVLSVIYKGDRRVELIDAATEALRFRI